MSTKEKFLSDVSSHQLTIIKDDGLHRHLQLFKPDSSSMHFQIITWPGYLCICGDMHTFVFRRVKDMFKFFRNSDDDWGINAGYWQEKLQAPQWSDKSVKAFDIKEATEAAKKAFDQWKADLEPGEYDEDVLEQLTDNVGSILEATDEFEFVQRIRDFDNENTSFDYDDFWESSIESYSYHYLWCCHAIVWGIQQYDAIKSQEPTA